MSIATIVTRGYGNFGSISEIVTRGYTRALIFDPSLIPDRRFAMGNIIRSPKRSIRQIKQGMGRNIKRIR